jgi:hypothetical protein
MGCAFERYEITMYRSPTDGAMVIEIDTPDGADEINAEGEPSCRIYLNEACVHEGTPFTEKSAEGL